MQAAVSRLFIFGDGINKFLYAASQGFLNGYSLSAVRSSFSRSNSYVLPRKLSISGEDSEHMMAQEANRLQRSKLTTQQEVLQQDSDEPTHSSNHSDGSQIQPTIQIEFQQATPTFLFGCNKILAFCSISGEIRFYSQFSSKMLGEFSLGESYPVSCFMYERERQNSKQLYCEIGYQNNKCVSLNVQTNQATQVFFFHNLTRFSVHKEESKHSVLGQELSDGIRLQPMHINALLPVFVEDPVYVQEQHLDAHSLEAVRFEGGIRCIWKLRDLMFVGDDANVFAFEKKTMQGCDGDGYLLKSKKAIMAHPNRMEFMQFAGEVFCYTCYQGGFVSRYQFVKDKFE